MSNVLEAFANSVNAYRSGDADAIKAANEEWDAVAPNAPYDPDMEFEGIEDYEIPDLSDREYDAVANEYERMRGL